VAKQMELLHELVPTAKTAALLVNPAAPTAEPSTKDATAAARAIGLDLRVLRATSEIELEAAFAALAKLGADALLVTVDPFFDSRPKRLSDLASRSSMPTVYYVREFVQAGGLISYGASLTDAYRQAGLYAGRILRGEKPGDLPVVQPTIFDLTINLRTARSLGLTIPPSILARADEVIE